jgi:molybdenum cofactor cytidylyltransferase
LPDGGRFSMVTDRADSQGVAYALLLAAGASTRFQGRPKALLPVGQETALGREIRIATESGFRPLVVLGAHATEIRRAHASTRAEWVEHPGWAGGRTGSVQAGLRAIPVAADVLVWPTDHPFVQAKTVRDLLAARRRDAMGVWFLPSYGGRGGHPVLLGPPVTARLRELSADEPMRRLIPEFGPQVVRVSVSDPAVLANVDTEETYRRALAEWHRRGDA